jgi:glycosyltransferase involved in cell wall biosynthesis
LKKLAIISTHPIQYNAPVFKLLAERKNIQIKVFYTWEKSRDGVFDVKFGQYIKWDIPLLEGYEYQFVKNISPNQGSHHFKGMINPELNKEIENWGANAVLIFGWSFHSHLKAMKYFKGRIPVYFRGDSTLIDSKPGYKAFLRKLWLTYIYRYIDYAFYVGTNNKNYYLKHGLKEKQLIFAPHAIDNARFADADGEMERKAKLWKNELGIKESDLVFLYAGKFESKKDPLLLLKAANELKHKNLQFIFVGDGDLKNELIQLASDNLKIHFLPFQNQSQMPVLYRLADVFVLPSKGPNETWGLAVNEAMASGKAILVSDKVGCAPDLVKDNKNGYIFKAQDLNDLTAKILKFNPENCIDFGLSSLKIINDFSIENLVDVIEKQTV